MTINRITHEAYAEEYKNFTKSPDNIVSYLMDTVTDIGHRGSGKGGYFNRTQLTMSRTDRFGQNPMTSNSENVGLTFITRPKLNLSTSVIRQDPVLSTLDTLDPTSYTFAIRCMLDTEFANRSIAKNISRLCPWFDSDVPYINMLSNNLIQIDGWPSFDLAVSPSADGFFSENQTIAKGSDFLNQQYDLSLTFRDIQGGPVMALFYYWVYWIALLCRGDVWRYMEDTLGNRLCYTCGIYRFVLDPSKRTIVKWAKATGCFPRSVPMGQNFDISDRTHFISSTQEFSIPFVANHIEYWNPNTFTSFNRIMDRYGGPMFTVDGKSLRDDRIPLDNTASNNYKGIPYINTWEGRNELMWLATKDEIGNGPEEALAELKRRIDMAMLNNVAVS